MKLKTYITLLQNLVAQHPEYNDFRVVLESYRGDYYNFDVYCVDNIKDKSIIISGNNMIEEYHKHAILNIEEIDVNKNLLF